MRFAAIVAVVVLALGLATASADGEVGLVIQVGDQVETHCVAFTGSSITGDQVLRAAGKSIEQYGGTGGRTVCAIDQVGCFDVSDFDSCFCECKGRECTYWGFFTRKFGANWVYSSLGFNLLAAEDGDLHGWKWGVGGPSTAPVPVDITFEQVCGHPPLSTRPQPTATTPPAPLPTPSSPPSVAPDPTSTPGDGTVTTAVTTTAATATTTPAPSPSVIVTIGRTPLPPPTAGPGDDGNSIAGLLAFGVIAGSLVVAIIGAAIWRRTRGA